MIPHHLTKADHITYVSTYYIYTQSCFRSNLRPFSKLGNIPISLLILYMKCKVYFIQHRNNHKHYLI